MTFSGWLERLREWARTIKREVTVLWIAARDPRTPIIAKVVAAMVAAYALSPIDLIPDFIPVLGYLDDVIIVPIVLKNSMTRAEGGLGASQYESDHRNFNALATATPQEMEGLSYFGADVGAFQRNLPLGIMLALKLIPNHLTAEFRAPAQLLEGRPKSRASLTFVLSMWILACAVIIWWGWAYL